MPGCTAGRRLSAVDHRCRIRCIMLSTIVDFCGKVVGGAPLLGLIGVIQGVLVSDWLARQALQGSGEHQPALAAEPDIVG